MIVPVQPQLLTQRVGDKADLLASADSETALRSRPSARENICAPSIQIDHLVVESATPLSPAAIRDGFRTAWAEHDHTEQFWSPDAFRSGLRIDLPPEVTGRELGRRLAQAILRRARVH